MTVGFCHLAIIPLRAEPTSRSEMVSQLLFGETYSILEEKDGFTLVISQHDQYQGYISQNQVNQISAGHWSLGPVRPVTQPFSVYGEGREQRTLVKGSWVPDPECVFKPVISGRTWVEAAQGYLNSPYLWGGRHPLGIDCSGLTQMSARIAGISLPRDAYQQAIKGETVEFLELAQAGDLAFFANADGNIIHTGILTGHQTIIHAHGWVREDRIDHQGIFNGHAYTHKLRIVKRFVNAD